MYDLAATRRDVGDLDGARQLHEQTLTARRRVLGEDHPDTLRSMNSLASILAKLATWTAPASCTNRPWPPASGCWALETPETLTAMNDLAATHWALADLEAARQPDTKQSLAHPAGARRGPP